MARGTDEDQRRVRILTETFVALIEGNGRLRDSYDALTLAPTSFASGCGKLAWMLSALCDVYGAEPSTELEGKIILLVIK